MAAAKKQNVKSLDPLPKSQGVVAHHIEQAFVYGSKHQQNRIEAYGRLNRKVLKSIGKPALEDGTVSKKAAEQLQRSK